jgi:ABC-type lipoprotein export system ATPase subunit
LLGGLCSADGGAAVVAGDAPRATMPWAQVAMVPQVLGLAIELSIRENITDAAAGSLDTARLDGLLDRLDLRGFADRCIDEVSMGQQQRSAVARELVQVLTVLLVDEPTSYQDGAHALAVIDEFRRAAADGCAVLVATHDDAVVAAADRVLDLQAA